MNQSGTSLLGLLSGLAVMSVVVAGATALSLIANSTTSRLESRQDEIILIQDIQAEVASQVNCTAAMPAGQTFDIGAANSPSGNPFTLQPSPTLRIVAGERVGNYKLVTQSVGLIGALPDGGDVSGNTYYISQLVVQFSDSGLLGAVSPPRVVTPLRLTVDAGGLMVACEGHSPISAMALKIICESFYGTWSDATGKCTVPGGI